MIYDAVNQLNLDVSFYTERYMFGGIIKHKLFRETEEIYFDKPLQISIDKSSLQPIDLPIYFRILNKDEFSIEANGENILIYNYLDDNIVKIAPKVKISGTYKFGEEIKGENYSFKVHLPQGNNFQPSSGKVYF